MPTNEWATQKFSRHSRFNIYFICPVFLSHILCLHLPTFLIVQTMNNFGVFASSEHYVTCNNHSLFGTVGICLEVNKCQLILRSIVSPTGSAWVCSFISGLRLQLLGYHLTVLRGYDVDQPRNLAKSVTTQWNKPDSLCRFFWLRGDLIIVRISVLYSSPCSLFPKYVKSYVVAYWDA